MHWKDEHRPRALGYLSATRHPWSCFLFLLPLLVAYEIGVLWLGGARPEQLRNGADTWLRWGLEACGLYQLYWAPALVAVLFLYRSGSCRRPRPDDPLGVWLGMAIESLVYAFGLWGLSRGLGPLLDRLGVPLSLPAHEEILRQVVTFVGAGIYEEVLFRLFLYAGLFRVLRLLRFHWAGALLLAAVTSSLVFAAAHHMGPYGEPFDRYAFLFRTIAGLYFTVLYQFRGFGIAVGAHAGYDVLVGVLVS